MLEITEQQMIAFSEVADAAFARRLGGFLRRSAPTLALHTNNESHRVETVPTDILERCIRSAMGAARSFELTAESALASFVAFSFLLGPRFYEAPDVRAALTDETVPRDATMDYVASSISPARAAELRATGSREIWLV